MTKEENKIEKIEQPAYEKIADAGYVNPYIIAKNLELIVMDEADHTQQFVGLGVVGVYDEKIILVTMPIEQFRKFLQVAQDEFAKK